MIELLRERKLKSLQASHRYLDTIEKVGKEQAERAKNVAAGKNLAEEHLRELYYSSVSRYKHKTSMTFRKALTGRALSLWTRVVEKQRESGVSPEDYIKAQFDWMHRNFGTYPKISQLATDNAVLRAKEFLGLSGNVVSSTVEVKKDIAQTFKAAEKSLRQICKKQNMSREEVYRNLVIPGFIVFPKEFLNSDPVYRKVLDEQ